MKLYISEEELFKACEEKIISHEQATSLWGFLKDKSSDRVAFTGINVTYYIGSLIVISAMTWLATEAFSKYSSLGLLCISLVYFSAFLLVGIKLINKRETYIPGGLVLTIAVFMVPLAIFSVQKYFDLWVDTDPGNYSDYFQWIKGGWFFMELGTIIASVFFLYFFGFPLLTFPLAFTLWFLSMDLTPLFFDTKFSFDERKIVSLYFGLSMLLFTYFIDKKTRKDYAFWLYLFGLISFWGGLTLLNSDSELNKFLYFCINLVLILIAVLFNRIVFIVFGGFGCLAYLFHLSEKMFKDSILFPFVLSLIGILLIWLGIKYSKHKIRIEKYLDSKIPVSIANLIPKNR